MSDFSAASFPARLYEQLMNTQLKLICIIVAAMSTLASASSGGAEATSMQFSLFEPCDGNGSMCATQILAQGLIESETPEKFERFLLESKLGKITNMTTITMVFDSPGGNLLAAMRLGNMIRAARIDTELGPEYSQVIRQRYPRSNEYNEFVPSAICASACTLAFVGGVKRTVANDSRFGVHQFSLADGQAGDGMTQVTVVAIAEYLQQMGVDRRMLDRASVVDPRDIAWLARSEIDEFRIDNTRPYLEEWTLEASDAGEPLLVLEQSVGPGKVLRMMMQKQAGRILLVVQVQFDTSVIAVDRLNYFPTGQRPIIHLSTNAGNIPLDPFEPWSREGHSSEIRLTSIVSFDAGAASVLQSAHSIELDDGFPNVISDLRFSTTLSTQGIKSGLALLLRSR